MERSHEAAQAALGVKSRGLQPAGDVSASPRVLGMLVGDIRAPGSGAQVKYGQLFAALTGRCHLLDVCDMDLRGLDRVRGAIASLRPSRRAWREAFYKHPWSYGRRSARAREAIGRRSDVDVVLQHGAIFHAHAAGPPVVIYTDSTYRLAQRGGPWRDPLAGSRADRWDALEREAYHAAALVLTRSEHARRSLVDDYGLPPERTAVVGAGVNLAQLPPDVPPSPAPRILFVGRDFERKGGDLLLAAFARARERIPDAELWLVTDTAGLGGPGVRRIPPTYDREALARLFRAAGAFAMPSRYETWGDVFLEAMAYGLPCVATRADAMPEIVEHGQTGLLVPPGDVAALAESLVTLLSDHGLRQRMGASGRQRVAETFTWEHVADRIATHLARVATHT